MLFVVTIAVIFFNAPHMTHIFTISIVSFPWVLSALYPQVLWVAVLHVILGDSVTYKLIKETRSRYKQDGFEGAMSRPLSLVNLVLLLCPRIL